jgi:cell division protein FtsN
MLAGLSLMLGVGMIYFLNDSQYNITQLTHAVNKIKGHNHTDNPSDLESQVENLSLKVDNILDQQANQITAVPEQSTAVEPTSSTNIPLMLPEAKTEVITTTPEITPAFTLPPLAKETVPMTAVDETQSPLNKPETSTETTSVLSVDAPTTIIPIVPNNKEAEKKAPVVITPDISTALDEALETATPSTLKEKNEPTTAAADAITPDSLSHSLSPVVEEIAAPKIKQDNTQTPENIETIAPSLSDTLLQQKKKSTEKTTVTPNKPVSLEAELTAKNTPSSSSDNLLQQQQETNTPPENTLSTVEVKKKVTPKTSEKGWVVVLASFKNAVRAKRNRNRYTRAKISTKISTITGKRGRTAWHQVITQPFKRKSDARHYSKKLKRQFKLKSTMITKR